MSAALSPQPEPAPPHERYLFKPNLGSSHYWAITTLTPLVAGKSVLDIGAGGGGMGKVLRTLGASSLAAVEIDDETRAKIAPLYDQSYSTVEPLRGQKFDCILLLDVLEHMAQPFEYLASLESLLNPGGYVVISVPNIAHWSIRFSLLFGYFEYTSRGILDRTHLQYFNRRRFMQLLHSLPGCSVVSYAVSIEPVELLLPARVGEHPVFHGITTVRNGIAQILPGLMGFQHLGLLRREG